MAGPEAIPDTSGLGLARRALTFIEENALEHLSLAEVARAVGRSATHVAGYADVTHFIRLFRRTHGLTPAAWRRAVGAPVPAR